MTDEKARFAAPKGTNDILPAMSYRWQGIVRLAQDSFARAGYAPVETPAFEDTGLFARGVGETTEVVTKQMYTFEDLGGRSLTLRPEGTAPVMRAVLEHNLDRGPLPVKLNYASWMFRQERPQKGRYRQFFQVGIEAIGAEGPSIDAEVIEIGARFLRDAGAEPSLLLNSVGHPDEGCRRGYNRLLREFLNDRSGDLAPQDRSRIETNPLRTFDSKEEATRAVMAEAPTILEHLCAECSDHFGSVRAHLDDLDVAYELDPGMVRGLDYYTRTAFEFVWSGLGAQNAMGGGGRYDGLAEALGGPRLPGIGFALGVDRILLALDRSESPAGLTDVFIVTVSDDAAKAAFRLATRLRAAGIGADLDHAGSGMKRQMKDAGRSGARWAAILGDDELAAGEVTLKNLATGDQERIAVDDIERRVRP